ncbi:MAG: hypothetical protein LUD72_07405 [Bacteroidales bacterium]|nr:hypothetical protein [Bacteroidales bacterium]
MDEDGVSAYKENCVPKVLITNKDYLGVSFCPSVSAIEELKRKYGGRCTVWYPIQVGSRIGFDGRPRQCISRCDEDVTPDGYIVISTKEYRLQNPIAINLKKNEVMKMVNIMADEFVRTYNSFLADNLFKCVFYYNNDKYELRNIPGDDPSGLLKRLQSRLDFFDDDFDRALEAECGEQWL